MKVTKDSKVIVQGITGRQGRFHTDLFLKYGTKVVAGVTPGKGGQTVSDLPVYNKCLEAVEKHGADTSVVFVPAKFCYDACIDGISAGLQTLIVISEGIPVHDMVKIVYAAKKAGTQIIGPNTPGMMIPEQIKLGIMPSDLCSLGPIAILTKSGTLSYEISKAFDRADMGISMYIGIGGDPIRGTSFVDLLEHAEKDERTKGIVLIGEIGGSEEALAAQFISKHGSKPVFAYIAGKNAPEGKRMGHAGAIISGEEDTALAKIKLLRNAGAQIADSPWDLPNMVKKALF